MNEISFDELLKTEYQKIKKKKKISSYHEGYGLLAEELDEFWDEVKKKARERNKENALVELVQIATLCKRIAEDLGLKVYRK